MDSGIRSGVNQEQDDHYDWSLDFSPTMPSNPGTPTRDDIGHYDLEENLQIHANKENLDPSEEGWNAEPSAVDMSDDEDLTQSVSKELGNDLKEAQVANMDNGIDLQDVCQKESSGCLVE